MKIIQLNKRYYKIPEKWDELTEQQLLQVMDVLFLRDLKAEQMLLKLLQVLTGMTHRQWFKCSVEDQEEYFYLLAFLLRADSEFTRNILPVICATSKLAHYGPMDGLKNLRMKEFVVAESYYSRWFESGKQDHGLLDQLVAILYRPAPPGYDLERNPNGDHREPYNQNISSFNATRYISKWPKNIKLAIATWYDGCRRKIVADNPEVFSGEGDDTAQYGLISVMLDLAEGQVFGKFQEVEEQYVHLILMQLNQLIQKSKNLEKQLSTNK